MKSTLVINKNTAVFIGIALFVTLLGMLSGLYLPDRFFSDAYTIALDRYNEKGWLGSYPFSMSFYDVTGLGKLPFSVVGLIQIPILFYLISRLGIPETFTRLTFRNLMIWTTLALIAFFISYPSKEFINVVYLMAIAYVLTLPISLIRKMLFTTLLFAFFSWFFRSYYLLVPAIALCLYVINLVSIRNKAVSNIVVGLVFVIFLSLAHGLIKGEFFTTSSRENLNYERLAKGDQDADTMILSPVGSDNIFEESVSILYGFFTVNLPINALKFWYKPQVIIFIFFQIALFLLLFRIYGKVLKSKRHSHELWVLNLLFAYFMLQGVFEPDLGSAIRHKIGVIPLIWLAIYYDKGLIKRPTVRRKYILRNV